MPENAEKPPEPLNSKQKNLLKATLLTSPEGRLLLAGVTLAFLFTFWLGIKFLFSPTNSQVIVGMTATQVMFGRAAGMAFGYSLALGHTTIIPISIIIETILVFIFYPLFVFSWQHILVIKWPKNIFERTRKTAEARKGIIQKYGIIGLFVFVWFPFWMTGPMIGCVIGVMLGLPIWTNLAAVLGGTYLAIFGWAFFLSQFHDRVASYSSYAPMVLMALLVIIIILAHLMHKGIQEAKIRKNARKR